MDHVDKLHELWLRHMGNGLQSPPCAAPTPCRPVVTSDTLSPLPHDLTPCLGASRPSATPPVLVGVVLGQDYERASKSATFAHWDSESFFVACQCRRSAGEVQDGGHWLHGGYLPADLLGLPGEARQNGLSRFCVFGSTLLCS